MPQVYPGQCHCKMDLPIQMYGVNSNGNLQSDRIIGRLASVFESHLSHAMENQLLCSQLGLILNNDCLQFTPMLTYRGKLVWKGAHHQEKPHCRKIHRLITIHGKATLNMKRV